jgi:hypothetical protein
MAGLKSYKNSNYASVKYISDKVSCLTGKESRSNFASLRVLGGCFIYLSGCLKNLVEECKNEVFVAKALLLHS